MLVIDMKVGDRVRIKESVVVYHSPTHRNQPYDLQGMTGEIVDIIRERDGKPISANFPFVVKFDDSKFRAHLKETELEPVE
jgi:hypothetical protein